MARYVRSERCPNCAAQHKDRKGDNLAVYDDGSTYCFSCKRYSGGLAIPENKSEWRGITNKTLQLFNVKEDNKELYFDYGNLFIARGKQEKVFRTYYPKDPQRDKFLLFGQNNFNTGCASAITICEGAVDALSFHEIFGPKYPVVAVRSASTATKDCKANYDYLNGFEKIYLLFDNDEPGREAAKAVSQLFDINKVFIVEITKHKDVNDFLVANEGKALVSVWWNAGRYRPKGVVSSFEEISKALKENKAGTSVCTYPWASLNEMTYGLRTGEVVVLLAKEKIGKTEVCRAIEHHALKTTDHNIGIIHIEEGERRTIQGLAGYELQAPVHLPDSEFSNDQVLEAYKNLVRREDRCFIYSHYGSDDPNAILDVVRYLAAVQNCKLIVLDHITMVVTGFADQGEDERRKLDYISTRLGMMSRELDFGLVMVSHVNDDGKARGSRNITKVADLIMSLDRDPKAGSERERNSMSISIEGNRYASKSGPAGKLYFDPEKFILTEDPGVWPM